MYPLLLCYGSCEKSSATKGGKGGERSRRRRSSSAELPAAGVILRSGSPPWSPPLPFFFLGSWGFLCSRVSLLCLSWGGGGGGGVWCNDGGFPRAALSWPAPSTSLCGCWSCRGCLGRGEGLILVATFRLLLLLHWDCVGEDFEIHSPRGLVGRQGCQRWDESPRTAPPPGIFSVMLPLVRLPVSRGRFSSWSFISRCFSLDFVRFHPVSCRLYFH